MEPLKLQQTTLLPQTNVATSSSSTSTTSLVLGKTNGKVAVLFLVIWQLVSMFLAYFLAVQDGDVPPLPHIPMISDCGCYYPESNVFQIGFITTAALMFVCSYLFSDYVMYQNYATQDSTSNHYKSINATNTYLTYLSGFACFCLAFLSSVNECEGTGVPHSVAAVCFFVAYLVYMIFICKLLRDNSLADSGSLLVKEAIAGSTLIDLILFCVFNALGSSYSNYWAACEWIAVFMILAFNISFTHEFSQGYYMAVVYEATGMTTATTLPTH